MHRDRNAATVFSPLTCIKPPPVSLYLARIYFSRFYSRSVGARRIRLVLQHRHCLRRPSGAWHSSHYCDRNAATVCSPFANIKLPPCSFYIARIYFSRFYSRSAAHGVFGRSINSLICTGSQNFCCPRTKVITGTQPQNFALRLYKTFTPTHFISLAFNFQVATAEARRTALGVGVPAK